MLGLPQLVDYVLSAPGEEVERPLQDPAAAVAIAKRGERVLSHLAEQPECSRAMTNRGALPEGSWSVRHVLSPLFDRKSGLYSNGKCGMKMLKSTH